LVLIAGRIFAFAVMILLVAALQLRIMAAKKGADIGIRRIPALDAVDEALGRATEMGRPVHFSSGVGDISTSGAPQMLAGLEILSHVAQQTAKLDAKLIVTVAYPTTFAVTEDVVRNSYTLAGRPDSFSPDMIRFLSPNQWAYAGGVVGIINREKVASNIIIGGFAAEALLIAEAANLAGALQIAGTTNMFQLPFFIIACDYTLIAEEMFAGAAYFSRDPVALGSLSGQDFGKLLAAALIVAGVIFTSVGSKWLITLIKK